MPIDAEPLTPWMTRRQVADYVQVDLQTVDNWSAAGILKKHSLGRVVRFHRDEVDAAMRGALA
jgi:excisionase family DNA binding protein